MFSHVWTHARGAKDKSVFSWPHSRATASASAHTAGRRSPARCQASDPRAVAHSSARSHARLRVRRPAFGAANAFESIRLRASIGLKFYAPGWGAGERRLLTDPYLLLSNIMPKVGSSQKSLFACAWPRRTVLTPVRMIQNACGGLLRTTIQASAGRSDATQKGVRIVAGPRGQRPSALG